MSLESGREDSFDEWTPDRVRRWETCSCREHELVRLVLYRDDGQMSYLQLDPEETYDIAQALLEIYDEVTQ